MKKITFIIVCLVLSVSLYAQINHAITGTLLDDQDNPVEYANVLLKFAKDSSMIKVEYSDDKGEFHFYGIEKGEYFLTLSYVGLSEKNTEIFSFTDETKYLGNIKMENAISDLAEVVVSEQRPILEVKPDMLIFNVDGSINAAGSNALELLRKSPGVLVDHNENINILGRSRIQIYINNKPSKLSSADLASYLKSIQSSQIDAIEIITNPSAKYDAEGGAGIINIRMKKNEKLGANSAVNLGYSIGQQARYNGDFHMNYRNEKLNIFGNYGYSWGALENEINLFRQQSGFAIDNSSLSVTDYEGHQFQLGTDYFINKKNTIGFLVNGNSSDNLDFNNSSSPIYLIGTSTVDSFLVAKTTSNDNYINMNYNVNYQFNNQKGRKVNLDADYGFFDKKNDQLQPNQYLASNKVDILNEFNYRSLMPTKVDIKSIKVDFENPVYDGVLALGVKLANVTTDNTLDFFNLIDDQEYLDKTRSNNFIYSENVNAFYTNYSKTINKVSYQVGLRVEQTISEGILTSQITTLNDNVKRKYIDLFPSAGLTYQISPKSNLQLSYSRRINRPNYQDLNPFQNKLDELTFEQGNPFLNPEYVNTYKLTHTFKYRFSSSFSVNHTKDLIARITDVEGSKGSFITWLNLKQQHSYGLNFSGAIPINNWWSSYTNLTGLYTKSKADYGEEKVVDLAVTTFNIFSQHTFRLPKDFSLEVSGWFSSPSIWQGSVKMNSMGSLNAGIQKSFLQKRGNLKLAVNDIFWTTKWSGVSELGDLIINASGFGDSRRVSLNFSYLFGNIKVLKSRNRKLGSESESKRIKK